MKPLTLDNLQADGACAEGIEWITPLLAAVGPTEADWLKRPSYWAWAVLRGYDAPVSLTLARKLEPWVALHYALDRLTDEAAIEIARRCPWAGLRYALDRLPDEVVIELARLDPRTALEYARDRLPADVVAELREMAR